MKMFQDMDEKDLSDSRQAEKSMSAVWEGCRVATVHVIVKEDVSDREATQLVTEAQEHAANHCGTEYEYASSDEEETTWLEAKQRANAFRVLAMDIDKEGA